MTARHTTAIATICTAPYRRLRLFEAFETFRDSRNMRAHAENLKLTNTRNYALNTPNASAPGLASASSTLPAQPAEASINHSHSPLAESLKDIYQSQGLTLVKEATARWREHNVRWDGRGSWGPIFSLYDKLVDSSKLLPNEASQYEDDCRKLAIAITVLFASKTGPDELSGHEFNLLIEMRKKNSHFLSQYTSEYPIHRRPSAMHYVLYMSEAFVPEVKHCVANSLSYKHAQGAFNGVWHRLTSPIYEPSA